MQNKSDNNLLLFFYNGLIISGIIPYLTFIFPFLPTTIFGFNYSGIAWITMLIITIITFFSNLKNNFPILIWLPWIIFLLGYIIYDFSFPGFQLTLQYLLPIFVGIVASGFIYNKYIIMQVFKRISVLCGIILILFYFSYSFSTVYVNNAAAVPMTLSIGGAIALSIYYLTHKRRYLVIFFILFLVPIILLTRMGILVFLVIFAFHFGVPRYKQKALYIALSLPLGLLIFFSQSFQNKTFYSGSGELSDINVDYYNSEIFNTSGRTSWKMALEEGLEKKPIWGNGPRSDNEAFIAFGFKVGEAHNDYLAVRYNYGYIGLILFLGGLLAQFISLMKKKKETNRSGFIKILWASTAILFLALTLFMYSDNILKYTIFFPDIFFAMIGILYAPYIVEKKDDQSKVNEIILLP
jgi:hypothetical protein